MNIMKHGGLLVLLLIVVTIVAACGTKVTRIETDEVVDLSGRWNDTDSQLVAEGMINDCLNHPWANQFLLKTGRTPDLIVGTIRNKSSEHISIETFTKDLERAIINSGKASFVASSEERSAIRAERRDQDLNAAFESRKAAGQEAGADYMLIGSINSIVDRLDNERVVYYQVNLELIDMTDNRKVWIGDKKIKKFVERAKYKY